MSANMPDSSAVPPEQISGSPTTGEPEPATRTKPPKTASKSRTKRPRPTFEDGSLTRMFKFPSRAYPRSSYYVTADEVIIRIKKARKRWKLVIPKKRLVSYKTNRWFAKPRWVEIELTYTQAVKLKLVEPRAPADTSPATGLATENTVADTQAQADTSAPAGLPIDATFASESTGVEHTPAEIEFESDAEIRNDPEDCDADTSDDSMSVSEEDPADDASHEWDEASPEELAAESAEMPPEDQAAVPHHDTVPEEPSAHSEVTPSVVTLDTADETVAAAPADVAKAEPKPGPEPISMTVAPVVSAEPLDPPPTAKEPDAIQLPPSMPTPQPSEHPASATAQHSNATKPARRFDANVWALTLMVAATATAWVAIEEWKGTRSTEQLACTSADKGCFSPITTGSIEPAATSAPPQTSAHMPTTAPSEPPPSAAAEATATPVVVAMVPTPEPAPTVAPPSPAATAKSPDVLAPPHTSALANTNTQIAVAAASTTPPNVEPAKPMSGVCLDLAKPAAALTVRFDFASSSLDQIALAGLQDLASKLQPCTKANITIEGHTDSDGAAERNHALSVRRANEVRAFLVNAGIDGARLTAVGFGPSRPQAPNTSPENKRENRRVTISVEVAR